jgi:hypothetical protein
MKLTIIPDDSFVSVDSDSSHHPLDLSSCNIPDEVHALQWFNTKGWIEFDDPIDPFSPKPPNEMIETLPEWALACVGVWEAWTPPAPPPIPDNQPVTTGVQTA